MKNTLLQTLLCSGLVTASLMSNPALAESAPPDWAGSYIGAHAGYGWNGFNNSPGIAGPDGASDSWLGGAQVGYNWQIHRVVLSVEGDASKMDFISKNPSSTYDEDWMSTVRARAGYSFGRMLPYATAGLGMTDAISKIPGIGSDSSVQSGFAVGGGVDFLMSKTMEDVSAPGHWFGRIEYLNVDVPNNSDNVGGTTVRGGSNNNIVRVGLNYKF